MKKIIFLAILASFLVPISSETYLSCSYDKKGNSIKKLINGKIKVKSRKIKKTKSDPQSFKYKYLLLKLGEVSGEGREKEICKVNLGNQINQINNFNWDCNAFEETLASYYLLINEEKASGDAYLSREEGSGKSTTTLELKHFEELDRESLIFIKSDKKYVFLDYTDAEIARKTKPTGTWALDFSNKMTYRDRHYWAGPEEKWFCSISDLEKLNIIKGNYNKISAPFLEFQRKQEREAKKEEAEYEAKRNKSNKI